jgi:hypothetical protein
LMRPSRFALRAIPGNNPIHEVKFFFCFLTTGGRKKSNEGKKEKDTHYTEWYRYPEWFFLSVTILTTHPRVHPLHWGTLFSSQTNRTLSDTHDTEGYPWHWVIPITLSSSQ